MQNLATAQPIKKLSHMHEQIMLWMIEHPERRLGDCAKAFNITQSWLSQLISSDLFQARLAELQQQQFEVGPISVAEKLSALALLTLDKLCDRVELEPDPEILNDILRTATKAMGLGAAAGGVQINNPGGAVFVAASKEALDEARKINAALRAATPPRRIEDDSERSSEGTISDRRDALDVQSRRVDEAPEFGPSAAG